ncbi:MAG: family transcriptional regulator [Naasia sp.]|nr:family transcriptional regulator [Naasia sp.]
MLVPVRTLISGPTASSADEVFRLLRDGRPRTRAELAAITGLARSTVAARVESLMGTGLIAPVGDAVSTGGRPPSQFALNPSARVVIGADLGARHADIAIADLNGAVISRRRSEQNIADGPEKVLAATLATARELLTALGRDPSDVVGLGMGVPGPVEHETGRPSNPPIMPGWDGFDIPGWVAQHLPVPVLVDNDVNIMALGEHRTAWGDVDDLLFVKVATGIGAGIISAGHLQRGAQGTAGDIGHVQVEKESSVLCRCGSTGCLEALAAGPAVARDLRGLGENVESDAEVVDLARSGNIAAVQAVRQAGRLLGEVLAIYVNMMNPSVITLGGAVSEAGEHLIAGVREVVYARSMPLATRQLIIAPSKAGRDAGVVGAAILAAENAFTPAGLEAMRAETA